MEKFDLNKLEQGTAAWLRWRHNSLTATTAAIILGISPWRTGFDLWKEKVNEEPPKPTEPSFVQRKGIELEPKARALVSLLLDIDFPPALIENINHPFLRASLDGYHKESNTIIEIKYQGQEPHEKAESEGFIQPYYMAQLQFQLLITGAKKNIFCSFDGSTIHTVDVYPDEKYCVDLLDKLLSFWALVQNKTPPPLSDRDYKIIRDKDIKSLIDQWKILKVDIDNKIKLKKSLEDDITKRLDHNRVRCKNVRIYKVKRKGSIDYKQVPALMGLDLEEYRKPITEYFKFEVIKNEKSV